MEGVERREVGSEAERKNSWHAATGVLSALHKQTRDDSSHELVVQACKARKGFISDSVATNSSRGYGVSYEEAPVEGANKHGSIGYLSLHVTAVARSLSLYLSFFLPPFGAPSPAVGAPSGSRLAQLDLPLPSTFN